MATGSLSDANIPAFAQDFEGIVAHTGRYPKDGIDFQGTPD
jgi:cation diffusion facilitator CzcD-associated flavoprotein CzcO